MTLLILLIQATISNSCVCFIFGSFGLFYDRTNWTILTFCVVGIALRASCTLGKQVLYLWATHHTSNSQETEWMSSPLLVKSFGFVSLSCDLEGVSFPKVPHSRRSYCFKRVRLFMVASENSGVLLSLWTHLNWAPEDSACPFFCGWGSKNSLWSNDDDTWCSWASSLLMCLKSSGHWWVMQIVKSWKAYFVARLWLSMGGLKGRQLCEQGPWGQRKPVLSGPQNLAIWVFQGILATAHLLSVLTSWVMG